MFWISAQATAGCRTVWLCAAIGPWRWIFSAMNSTAWARWRTIRSGSRQPRRNSIRFPFANASFDLAIFNASIHYSTDYRRTLTEVRRCLRPGGRLVIIDSPVYRRREHGEKMRAERRRYFEQTLRLPLGCAPQHRISRRADARRARSMS